MCLPRMRNVMPSRRTTLQPEPSLSADPARHGRFDIGPAVMMPASLALIRENYTDPRQRARAIALWSLGAGVASAAGPVVGGFLTLLSWRLIFFVNLPIGALALYLLTRVARSPHQAVPFDWVGQVAAVLGTGALTYGLIAGGAEGFSAPRV